MGTQTDPMHVPERATRLPPAPPAPANEHQRIEALRRYQILDTGPEPAFDRVTRLASRMFNVPMVRIALIDEHRQWLKSHVGPTIKDARRELSFCTHALLADRMVVVPDTLKDPRFRDHPFVTGSPSLRFYAGAPVRSDDGFALGTLCLIDTRPRSFGADDATMLTDLTDMLSDALALRLARLGNGPLDPPTNDKE